MSQRLDILLAVLAVLFFAQLQWHPLPERVFQGLAGIVVAVYFWQLVLTYRRHPEGEPGTPGPTRWVLVLVLLAFFVYVALRFMWAAAG